MAPDSVDDLYAGTGRVGHAEMAALVREINRRTGCKLALLGAAEHGDSGAEPCTSDGPTGGTLLSHVRLCRSTGCVEPLCFGAALPIDRSCAGKSGLG
jgi:hypothetical protein